jgi:hypothetical protein
LIADDLRAAEPAQVRLCIPVLYAGRQNPGQSRGRTRVEYATRQTGIKWFKSPIRSDFGERKRG